jgi:hypothetical protein
MMPMKRDQSAAADDLIFRAPGLDERELMHRIHTNGARRGPLPQVAASLGLARLADERQQLLNAVKDLQGRMRDCGSIPSRRHGWVAAIERFVKKSVRRLLLRHHLQQHRVHLKLAKVLNQLVRYLEYHDDCVRACLDQTERTCEETAALRVGRDLAEFSQPLERPEPRVASHPR